jgi:hypothetical protein
MMSSKAIAAVVVGLILFSGAWAQVGPGLRFVPQADGLTVLGPASGQFFRMKIPGKDASRLRTKKNYWFRADGINFQFFSEENTKFLPTDIPHRLDDRAVVEFYESAFLRRRGNPGIRSKWVKLTSGRTALFGSYDKLAAAPGPGKGSEREMFLVIAGPGHVFGLFAPVPPDGSERETRDLLVRTLATLCFLDDVEN